ncbi:MAG: hypothetical protein JWN86_903 [Planctomycetota bacterium]|nr:hypothetical protein [Planctomycetota bacterium]
MEKDLADFVGPKASYYLDKWRAPLSGNGSDAGFNWAAFFLSGLWLAYRKMYLATFIFLGIIAVETFVEEMIYASMNVGPQAQKGIGRIINLIIAFVCGRFGNTWYLSHALKVVNDVRSQGLPEDETAAVLARRGGRSVWLALGAMVMFTAVLVATFIAVELMSRS